MVSWGYVRSDEGVFPRWPEAIWVSVRQTFSSFPILPRHIRNSCQHRMGIFCVSWCGGATRHMADGTWSSLVVPLPSSQLTPCAMSASHPTVAEETWTNDFLPTCDAAIAEGHRMGCRAAGSIVGSWEQSLPHTRLDSLSNVALHYTRCLKLRSWKRQWKIKASRCIGLGDWPKSCPEALSA